MGRISPTIKKYNIFILGGARVGGGGGGLRVIKAVFANLQIPASWRRLFFERPYLVIYLPK